MCNTQKFFVIERTQRGWRNSEFLKLFPQGFVCARGNFISAGLANMVLVTSLADFNEVRFTSCCLYIFVNIYPESYVSITLPMADVVLLARNTSRSVADQFYTHSVTDGFLVWSSTFRAKSPDFGLLWRVLVAMCCLEISLISTPRCSKRFTASSDFSKIRHCLGESPSLPTYFGGMS